MSVPEICPLCCFLFCSICLFLYPFPLELVFFKYTSCVILMHSKFEKPFCLKYQQCHMEEPNYSLYCFLLDCLIQQWQEMLLDIFRVPLLSHFAINFHLECFIKFVCTHRQYFLWTDGMIKNFPS